MRTLQSCYQNFEKLSLELCGAFMRTLQSCHQNFEKLSLELCGCTSCISLLQFYKCYFVVGFINEKSQI